MDTQPLIDSLARFGQSLPAVVNAISSADARWKPADAGWSILEIVCHLGDEEEFDFRVRVKSTLETPSQAWPGIDPEGWAVTREYNKQDLAQAVARFVTLRRESVEWLGQIDQPDWSRTHEHPQLGPLRAGDIFAAWVAHDHLHLRQIAKRLFQMTQRDAGQYSIRYAGEWTA